MTGKKPLLCLIACFFALGIYAQRSGFTAMFYNVENYFDYRDDTLKNDAEFLPEGMRHWDKYKFFEKRNKIAKVLLAAGEWGAPAIIGLAEVENRHCVESLVYDSPLQKLQYRFIHKESPDERGIDAVLLYRPQHFEPLDTQFLAVHFPFDPENTTRDILYTKGAVPGGDTLHVFVNHWPSRWGGKTATQAKRMAAAKVLRGTVDSLLDAHNAPKILIMGDFNDFPHNKSLAETLAAQKPVTNPRPRMLYNLSLPLHEKSNTGTNKHQGKWGMLDQIIVSGALLNNSGGLHTPETTHQILQLPFLLENDDKYVGKKPNRTFIGYRFHGGFSDHLPVLLKLIENNF